MEGPAPSDHQNKSDPGVDQRSCFIRPQYDSLSSLKHSFLQQTLIDLYIPVYSQRNDLSAPEVTGILLHNIETTRSMDKSFCMLEDFDTNSNSIINLGRNAPSRCFSYQGYLFALASQVF